MRRHRRRRRTGYLAALFAAAALPAAWAQAPADGPPPLGGPLPFVHDRWRTDDGLPHNAVTAIHQTRDGYLWLGTAAGLVRFDGMTFAPVAPPAAPHLRYSYVWALHEDDDGALWVGTSDGLTRYAPGRVRTFADGGGPGALPVAFARVLARTPDGALWVGTYGGGVCRADGAGDVRFVCFGVADGLPDPFVNALLVDPAGRLWAGTDTGVARLDADAGRFVPGVTADGFRPDVKALLVDARGTLWLGTGDGLFRLHDGAAEAVRPGGRALDPVRTLFEDADGVLWIGTEGDGLVRLRDGRLDRSADDALTRQDVRALAQDREGSLWVGTNGGGLHRLRRGRVRVLAAAEGLPSDLVHAVLEDRAGRVWLATNAGLTRLGPDGLRTFTTADGLPDDRVLSLAEDADGRLWAGTNGGGLARLDGARFDVFTTADGLPSDVVFSLFADGQGRLWVGGQGVCRWTGDRCTPLAAAGDALAAGLVVTVAEARDGALWFGSDSGGLSRYDGARLTTYTTDDGLPSDAVRALHADADGLWIGTRGGGLTRYDGDRFVTFTTADGLPDDIVFRILEDDRGDLWLNTGRGGLARLEGDALADAARARAAGAREPAAPAPLVLGHPDGLRSIEGVGGFHPAGWKARDGRLWFPTHEGVVVVEPDRVQRSLLPPPVHVAEVRVDDVPVAPTHGVLTLPPGARSLEIRYAGLSFVDPPRVRFRYRLEGRDAAWVEAGARRSIVYDRLPPGRYTFRVTAAAPDGPWNAAPATLHLHVLAPWWRRPWAYVLWAALLGAALVGFVRWRVWHLRRRNRELEALVAARTAQVNAQAAQLRSLDELKSRFFANLSHELRTPLTLILGPLELARERTRDETARGLLGSVRTQAERMLRLVGELLDLARLDAGRLPLALHRGDLVAFLRRLASDHAPLADAQGVRLDFHAGPERLETAFDPNKLEHVVGNLLANAVKYTPEGGKAMLSVDVRDEALEVRVRDTGPGIAPEALPHVFDRFYRAEDAPGPAAARADDRTRLGTGIGLALARELAVLHGGTLTAESVPGFGSTFILRLPLRPDADAPPLPPDRPLRPAAEADAFDVPDEAAPAPDAPRVLVVEDHADVRAFVRRTLEPPYRVVEAATAEAALERARAEAPDLVVSDVMLPGMDGVALCRRLRADDALRAVPVILLTARADEESRLEGLGAGADDYLAKPFNPAELRLRAENLIEVRRHLRRRFSGEVVVQPTQVTVPSADAAFLETVRAAVEARLDDPDFTVEDLAETVHLSRRQLHRRLRALSGLSSVAFIRLMRLERAAQLLEQHAGSVADVAFAVGFQDANYFARVFRQAYGVPPSAYPADAARTKRSETRTDRS